jgi:hypothetical protein
MDVSVTDKGQIVTGPVPTIEAVKSYLIIHEASSADSYNLSKVGTALKAADQCQSLGDQEKSNPKNQVDGFQTTVSAKIVNNLEMPADFTNRYVCLISVLAVRQ